MLDFSLPSSNAFHLIHLPSLGQSLSFLCKYLSLGTCFFFSFWFISLSVFIYLDFLVSFLCLYLSLAPSSHFFSSFSFYPIYFVGSLSFPVSNFFLFSSGGRKSRDNTPQGKKNVLGQNPSVRKGKESPTIEAASHQRYEVIAIFRILFISLILSQAFFQLLCHRSSIIPPLLPSIPSVLYLSITLSLSDLLFSFIFPIKLFPFFFLLFFQLQFLSLTCFLSFNDFFFLYLLITLLTFNHSLHPSTTHSITTLPAHSLIPSVTLVLTLSLPLVCSFSVPPDCSLLLCPSRSLVHSFLFCISHSLVHSFLLCPSCSLTFSFNKPFHLILGEPASFDSSVHHPFYPPALFAPLLSSVLPL
ncbi:unnamed protein product [Acanthosepion pharaonis]|uniref:Uncharacterized protein n=1 Tax=Acanthosepion pharaonis TaxID=158019 RepID=A0A812DLD8_ACAPH|nr:unnamed protein product [Sepia pharaonis]